MTGLDGQRVYLDWNASAPLRPEARTAMLAAMDQVGNPSSVHAEGRAARAIVERARGQVAALVGCEAAEVVFTSGATEAAAMALYGGHDAVFVGATEHEAVHETALGIASTVFLRPTANGLIAPGELEGRPGDPALAGALVAVGVASGETGVVQDVAGLAAWARAGGAAFVTDATQALGRIGVDLGGNACDTVIASAHKLGGPKGIGLLAVPAGVEPAPLLHGGGQEGGRRSGTENVVGIAGFGAAAEAALRDLEDGVWDRVSQLRDRLEDRLESAAPDLILVGQGAPRLPNTSCFAVPGWAGETQVMQMDLAGFAVSAGSACSSGKVRKASRVLLAMGFDKATASSAIRVSMGPTTTEAEVMAFADAWIERYRRRDSRAA